MSDKLREALQAIADGELAVDCAAQEYAKSVLAENPAPQAAPVATGTFDARAAWIREYLEGVHQYGPKPLDAMLIDAYAAGQAAPATWQLSEDWPECAEFYNLMQAYRHEYFVHIKAVKDNYDAVKDWLRIQVRPLLRQPANVTRDGGEVETWTAQVEPVSCGGKPAKRVSFFVSDKFSDWDIVRVTVKPNRSCTRARRIRGQP